MKHTHVPTLGLPVLKRHVHPHKKNRGYEIHSFHLGEHKHDDIGRFRARDGVEELGHSQQKASNGSNDDDAWKNKEKTRSNFGLVTGKGKGVWGK